MATRQEIVRLLQNISSDIVRDLVVEATANIQEETPVDTGWAQNNWVPQIGSPFRGTAGTREEADEGIISSAQTTAGLSSVLTYDVSQGRAFLSNNVPYILPLNEGSSMQAPAGFIHSGLDQAIATVLARVPRA